MHAKGEAEHLEKIHAQIKILQADIMDYCFTMMPTKGAVSAEKLRLNIISRIKTVKQVLEEVKPHKSQPQFRDSVIKTIQGYEQLLQKECLQLIAFESTAERAFDDMNTYLNLKMTILRNLSAVFNQLYHAESQFAEKNNLQIDLVYAIKNKEALLKTDQVYTYYFDVFRIFFQSSILETYLIMSVVGRKIDQLEYHRSLLIAAAKRGREKLAKTASFHTDSSLVIKCDRLLKFYIEEAESEFPTLINYCIEEANFKMNEKMFLAKGENYSPDELTAFNLIKRDFELLTSNYDVTIERTNLFRVDRLTDWEEKAAEFLANYLPKNFN